MHHGREHEGQRAAAQVEHVAFLDDHLAALDVDVEKVGDHAEGLRVAHYLGLGVFLRETCDTRRVVGFHVMHDEVVGRFARRGFVYVLQPLVHEMRVHRIRDGYLLAHDDVRVIAHALGYAVLTFEKVDVVIVDARVDDVVCDLVHVKCSLRRDYIIFPRINQAYARGMRSRRA